MQLKLEYCPLVYFPTFQQQPDVPSPSPAPSSAPELCEPAVPPPLPSSWPVTPAAASLPPRGQFKKKIEKAVEEIIYSWMCCER